MVTVLTDTRTIEVPADRVEGERLWLSEAELEHATGWSSTREGLCRGGVWRHLGKPIVHSEDLGVWVLGEAAAERVSSLRSLKAPDFTLPDRAGRMHSLSDHRGQKVLLVSWASW